jgi:4-diphosphocytidyl-2-C-methyl-D-erythritol kinase
LPVPLIENAPAKINLTLRVLGRRDDGFHEIESLVAFADFGDHLSFSHGGELTLTVRGPNAVAAGAGDDNLVLKAARGLAARRPNVVLGVFDLEKRLPVAAGLGGGSADAAAALRLIAQANGLAADDPDLYAAARATGADVPVCLDPRPRIMRGIGEVLSGPLALPSLPAVLVNPGLALATKSVFAGWKPAPAQTDALDAGVVGKLKDREQLLLLLMGQSNDLEGPAIALRPVVAEALAALRVLAGCDLARMSGSGATCFGLFASAGAAAAAEKFLSVKQPGWWVKATMLGGA